MKKNYGYKPQPQEENHYVLGGGMIPHEILQPNGQWLDFLPEGEYQAKFVETFNCTAFNTLNPIEILIRRKFKESPEFSDRMLGILANTRPPGNDPFNVAEVLRKNAVVYEETLPFSEDLDTLEKYFSPNPIPEKLLRQAKIDFPYKLLHEHVWRDGASLKEKQEKLLKALCRSPLGISVVAWEKDANDLYIKDPHEQDNHWTCLVGYNEGKYWIVFDSYPEDGIFIKKLRWDYNFGRAELYYLEEGTFYEDRGNWVKDLANSFINFFKLIYARIRT